MARCVSVRLHASARLSHLDHPALRTAPAAERFFLLSRAREVVSGPRNWVAGCCFPSKSKKKCKKGKVNTDQWDRTQVVRRKSAEAERSALRSSSGDILERRQRRSCSSCAASLSAAARRPPGQRLKGVKVTALTSSADRRR